MHDTQDEQLSECMADLYFVMADLYFVMASVLIEASDGARGAKAICTNRVVSRRNDCTYRCHLKGVEASIARKGHASDVLTVDRAIS